MSVVVKINTVDKSDEVDFSSLSVTQNLTSQVDTATFLIRKYGARTTVPAFDDDIEIYDGAEKIFAGKILKVSEVVESGGGGVVYKVDCVDHTYEFDKRLVSRTYENKTIKEIIDDIVTSYAATFTTNNVASNFPIDKIVFNQVAPSACLKKLADILRFDWYIDADKDIHFFDKFTNAAPFDLTDDSGNFVYETLQRSLDGSQVVNRVKVRGGEYNGVAYTDIITVKGNDSKSFKLPYKFANLAIRLDTGGGWVAKNVGIDFIDDFGASVDVLHNYQDQTIRFASALADGNKIEFTGNPKVRVLAIAEDPASIALYGRVEKLLRDDSIKDNAVARRRASAELYAYANTIIDAKFKTYTAGLRSGMVMNVSSIRRSSDDDLLIKTIVFSMVDPLSFGYNVSLISTKRYDLIDLLQKILEPAPMDSDESETSEEIFTDTQEIRITEEIEFVTPVEADEDITITENIELNPLGAGVEPTWVFGPYSPTGQDDPKRPGRFDYSFKLY